VAVRYGTVMQTLWSRAAQPKCTCRCSSCLSFAASALSRRTTTATGRRRLKFGDAFTVFYSSIFATAAIVDAKHKDDRRKELDGAITEVKKELKVLEERGRARAELAGGNSHDTREVDREKLRWPDVLKLRPEDVDDRWTMEKLASIVIPPDLHKQLSVVQVEQILTSDRLLELLGGGWKVHPARKGVIRDGHCPPEVTTESLRDVSLKKLRTLELSVAKLVLRFLGYLSLVQDQEHLDGKSPQDPSNPAAITRDELWPKVAKMNRYLEHLRDQGRPTQEHTPDWPAHPAYDRGGLSVDGQKGLNAAISSIFKEHGRSKDHALMLKNLCSVLLLAPSPPDVTTYNLLLTHLTRLRQNELVRMVLESFDECSVRPNEITVTATLSFLTLSNDRKGFRSYVNRLRGRKGGVVLARPNIKITAAAEGRLSNRTGKVTQKPPKNIHVFGALINGILKFSGVKEGIRVYYEMLREGWEPNIPILTAILRRCNLNRDWVGGFAVWQHIQESSEYISDRAYLWMLQLCRACNRQEIYDEILRELKSQGVSMEFLPPFSTGKSSALKTDIKDLRKMMQKQRREAAKAVKRIQAPAMDLEQGAYDDDTDEAVTVAVSNPLAEDIIKDEEQDTSSIALPNRPHKAFRCRKGAKIIPAADQSPEYGYGKLWDWPIGLPSGYQASDEEVG